MTESMHRIVVVTRLPRSVPALLQATKAILTAMDGHPSFPRPRPSRTTLIAAVAALEDAEVALRTRTRGTRPVRDEARSRLLALLGALRAHVQSVADASPDTAVSVIESARMSVKRPALLTKPPFAVRPGRVSGSVVLAVRSAGDRAAYAWQWSLDEGATWHDAPSTLQAKTVVAGLPLGKMCAFRYRVATKDARTDWSEGLRWQVE
ncbi:MAG TPA: hypothetical protein VHS09_14195 [Polyangiaceae bacterium]|jgi:hypothetical protein|nr:hypothetical protein [Polyangiaceae bacterium]